MALRGCMFYSDKSDSELCGIYRRSCKQSVQLCILDDWCRRNLGDFRRGCMDDCSVDYR